MFELMASAYTYLLNNIFIWELENQMIVLSAILILLCGVVIGLITYMLYRMRQFRVKKEEWRGYQAHFDLLEQIDSSIMILPLDNMSEITSPSAYIYMNAAGQMFLKALNSAEKKVVDSKTLKRFRGDMAAAKKSGYGTDLRVGVFSDGTHYTLYYSAKRITVANQDCLLIALIPLNEYGAVIRRQLHEANETLDFLQNISQHIAEPLNALLERVNTLLHTRNVVHREGIIRALEVHNEKLQHTVQSIIDYSMLEYGHNHLKPYYHDVTEQIRSGLSSIQSLAKKYPEIELVISLPYNKLELDVDDMSVPTCLIVFIENAIRHVKKGRIEAGICYENGEFIAYCCDEGPGIKQQFQVSIFEKFARYGDKENLGVGMGLAMNKTIARLFKGLIGVVSSPGSGSLFWIQLPMKGHAELCENAKLTSTYSLLQKRNKGVWFDASSGKEVVVRGVQKGGRR